MGTLNKAAIVVALTSSVVTHECLFNLHVDPWRGLESAETRRRREGDSRITIFLLVIF